MKTIDIREQPILSLRRTVQITVNGIRYRLFRSAVTVVVVAVAVAFLMNILSESLVKKSLAQRTRQRAAELRTAAAWAGHLTTPGNVEETLLRVARAAPGDPAYREAAVMGGFAVAIRRTANSPVVGSASEFAVRRTATSTSEDGMGNYQENARQAASYLAFFGELDYARRRRLVHTATGTDIFDRLQEPEAFDRFASALRAMRSVRLPSSAERLREFLRAWPATKEQTLRIQRARVAAIAKVGEALKGRPALDALADAEGPLGDAVRKAGFALDPATAQRVAAQALAAIETRALQKSITEPEIRKAVAGYLDVLPTDVDTSTLWRLLGDRRSAAWYLGKLAEQKSDLGQLGVERAMALAGLAAEIAALTRAERLGMVSGGLLGIGERMTWLVLASMLVCVVGISNAMLMSVAERFREIATLKCLGALDGFILLMFVLEACFLGVVGGILGSLLGSAIGLGRMLLAYGSLFFSALPVTQLLVSAGLSVLLGVALAAIASVYPSLKASKLAPMEAMRIQ